MVTQEGTAENPFQSLWLIYRGQKRWLARSIMQEPTLTLSDIVSVPDSNMNAIRIKLPARVQPAERVLTWTRYYVLTLDPVTLEQNPGLSPWPVFGDGNTDSEF